MENVEGAAPEDVPPSSSAEAVKAAGQIMTLESEAKGCLDRLDELERVLGQQKRAFDTAEMNAKAMKTGGGSGSGSGGGGSSSSSSSASSQSRFGTASAVSDIDAQIAAAKADLAARAAREGEAKERFKEMEKSIATSEEHLANLELMSVQTPVGVVQVESSVDPWL